MQVHPNFLNRYYQDKQGHKHLVLINWQWSPQFTICAKDYDLIDNYLVSTGYDPDLIQKLVPELTGISRWQLWSNDGLDSFLFQGMHHAGFFPLSTPDWLEFKRLVQYGWRVGDHKADLEHMNMRTMLAWLSTRLELLIEDYQTDMGWLTGSGIYKGKGLKIQTVAEVSLT